MAKLEFWDKETDLYPMAGGKQTPADIFEKYGWTENPAVKVVIDNTGGIWGSIASLESLKLLYKIDIEDNNEALQAIEDIINTPPEPIEESGGILEEFLEGLLEGLAEGMEDEEE